MPRIHCKAERAHGMNRTLEHECKPRKKYNIDDDIKHYHNLYWNAKKDMEEYKKKVIALKRKAGYLPK